MRKMAVTVCLLVLALTPGASQAQITLGAQGSYGDEFDWAAGGRVGVGIPAGPAALEVVGSFDLFFPELDGVDYYEININLNYLIPVRSPVIRTYIGAGLNIAHSDVEIGDTTLSNTEYGLNLLAGIRGTTGMIHPFGEARFEIEGGRQFVFTGGLMLQVGPGI